MRKLLLAVVLLFTGLSHAQEGYYSENWKVIDSLEIRGLVESADSLTTEILASAKKRKDHLEFIKAKIYHYKFYQVNHENSNMYILDDVNTVIAGLPVPYKNVLLSYKATMLDNYFQDNRWRARNRSDIDDPDKGSIETWSLNTLLDSIHHSYELSLQNEKILIPTSERDIGEFLSSHL